MLKASRSAGILAAHTAPGTPVAWAQRETSLKYGYTSNASTFVGSSQFYGRQVNLWGGHAVPLKGLAMGQTITVTDARGIGNGRCTGNSFVTDARFIIHAYNGTRFKKLVSTSILANIPATEAARAELVYINAPTSLVIPTAAAAGVDASETLFATILLKSGVTGVSTGFVFHWIGTTIAASVPNEAFGFVASDTSGAGTYITDPDADIPNTACWDFAVGHTTTPQEWPHFNITIKTKQRTFNFGAYSSATAITIPRVTDQDSNLVLSGIVADITATYKKLTAAAGSPYHGTVDATNTVTLDSAGAGTLALNATSHALDNPHATEPHNMAINIWTSTKAGYADIMAIRPTTDAGAEVVSPDTQSLAESESIASGTGIAFAETHEFVALSGTGPVTSIQLALDMLIVQGDSQADAAANYKGKFAAAFADGNRVTWLSAKSGSKLTDVNGATKSIVDRYDGTFGDEHAFRGVTFVFAAPGINDIRILMTDINVVDYDLLERMADAAHRIAFDAISKGNSVLLLGMVPVTYATTPSTEATDAQKLMVQKFNFRLQGVSLACGVPFYDPWLSAVTPGTELTTKTLLAAWTSDGLHLNATGAAAIANAAADVAESTAIWR